LKPVYLLCARGLERLETRKNNWSKALQWANAAFGCVESMASQDGARGIGLLSGTSLRDDVERIVTLLCQQRRPVEALEFLERYRLHLLKSAILRPDLRLGRTYFSSMNSQRLPLRLAAHANSIVGTAPRIDGNSAKAPISSIIDTNCLPCPMSINEMRRRAPTETDVILEYLVTADRLQIFVVRLDTLAHFTVRIDRDELKRKIEDVSAILAADRFPSLVLNADIANFRPDKAKELYDLLMKPVEHFFKDTKRLVIVPDNPLYGLPFEVLVCATRDGATEEHDEFLISRYEISYAEGITELQWSAQNTRRKTRQLLALGNPSLAKDGFGAVPNPNETANPLLDSPLPSNLPGAEHEVEMVARIFTNSSDLCVREQATKSNFLKRAPDFSVLHVAAHATWDDKNPPLSRLLLAPDTSNGDSGELSVAEIAKLKLHSDLVVLSGCNTGRGMGYEGVLGFARAFRYAGAASTIASLWNVNDETTAYLMERFYVHLREGTSRSSALRLAKLDLIVNGEADPYYWAPFVLVGDPGSFELPVGDSPNVGPAVFVITIVLGLAFTLAIRRSWIFKRRFTSP
jgi:CHAT domain-containing protein